MHHCVTEMCTHAHFHNKMAHWGMWDWYIVGSIKQVCCVLLWKVLQDSFLFFNSGQNLQARPTCWWSICCIVKYHHCLLTCRMIASPSSFCVMITCASWTPWLPHGLPCPCQRPSIWCGKRPTKWLTDCILETTNKLSAMRNTTPTGTFKKRTLWLLNKHLPGCRATKKL